MAEWSSDVRPTPQGTPIRIHRSPHYPSMTGWSPGVRPSLHWQVVKSQSARHKKKTQKLRRGSVCEARSAQGGIFATYTDRAEVYCG